MTTTSDLYSAALASRRATAEALQARERRIAIARLISAASGVALLFWHAAAALVPLALFIALVIAHERVVRARKRAESGAAFYTRALQRVEGAWQGKGDSGAAFATEHHPYAADLDLFGSASLFELISIAVTHAGRSRLATWLKEPSLDSNEITSRQAAVCELREQVSLREELSVLAAEVTQEIESAKLERWSSIPSFTLTRAERIAAIAFPSATLILFLITLPSLVARLIGLTHPEARLRLGVLADVPSFPFVLVAFGTILLARRLQPRVQPLLAAVERSEPALALLAGVMIRIERETFTAERLVRLHAALRGADGRASEEIERLRRLVTLLDARRNQFFAPFALLLLWTTHVVLAIERWRARSGMRIGEWIESVGEIEALGSLASFALEHDELSMPEIVASGPLFDARDLGHPLIPAARRVTNDVRLDDSLRLLLVSGSNMSGKSTMMRSVGSAAVLAMAGGPVCASRLRLAPTALGASIRIHDSLQENASRFYAEIVRIRQVLELGRKGPLLYLLDEMLAGTNSHDRRIGAEAIVRSLVDRGAIGIISTHDLALAQIAEALAPQAANVHFEDRIEAGHVVFDYRMRAGVVTKSNALALMRSVGIEV